MKPVIGLAYPLVHMISFSTTSLTHASRSIFFSGGQEMAYGAKTYTLKQEAAEGGTRYSVSFKDGQGEHHELEVSETITYQNLWEERKRCGL